jgi:hypothetical protein
MKTGRTLVELAQEIERRANAKKDLVTSTVNLQMTDIGLGRVGLAIGDKVRLNDITPIAHGQIAEHTEIPKKYYDKMLGEAPDLLTNNVNRWFAKYPAGRMVRCLDNKARAFLSDKFRIDMENEDFAQAVLPVLAELKLDIMSCDITDRRLYIKAVDQRVSRELAKTGAKLGDGGHTIVRVVAPAITISNSEVGDGALSVQGGVYDRWCSNLGSFGERSMRQAHVGGRHSVAEGELYAMLSDKSKRLDTAALWSKVADVVRGVFDLAKFNALVDKIEGSQAEKIETTDVVKVVENVNKQLGFNETEGKSVLKHLIEGGDLSRFGVYNAVTRMAQDDIVDYDRATQLERIGAKVIELPRDQWKKLAEAA